ncbi:uncharacterized protein LOC132723024 [Ruditapes philippinarum]|uniref:uncharacterized protein LOC132723024 n=1 Tax=Ruditapes philippinarum TaxID=129788 RepID=UPI00295BBA00|nr:uncharacterized protein LOC132723024 [Ruditapes philippinarum]XP_060563662.1 uncharacterized protein LOC132723024 [Ruditapes philippinarum]XP_060563663.1 uncharacterized protein LOC132723024 [Ruditapes philippinarum]
MGLGEEVDVKRRKVIFDEYTGGFYAESKVESLQRQCEYRAKLTDVMNKAEEAKYKLACKQVNAEKHMFLIRKEKATHRHSEALQDYKAHMNVLDKLAKEREEIHAQMEDIYGKYPPKSLRSNIEELIEGELKEMRPVVRRRREATKLLDKRNELTEVDRTMSTEDLFDNMRQRKSRVPSPVKSASRNKGAETPKPVPRLILPAITVRLGNNNSASKTRVIEPVSVTRDNTKSYDENAMLPSVFVTDPRSSALG